MKFSTSLAVAGTAIGLATALPAPEPQGFPPVPPDTVYYYFKTQVQDSQPTKFNDLYLNTYHTGAGQSDAALVPGDPLPAQRGWFNGTTLNWFQPFNGGIFFGVEYNLGAIHYAAWAPVTINGGIGTPGLGLDGGNRLVVLDNDYWDSWLVCDWWHSVPQLFTLAKYKTPVIPSSCAKVDLVAEVAPPRNSTVT